MSTRSHSVYIYMLVAKGTTSLEGRENICQAPPPFPMCLSLWKIIGKGLLRLEGHFLISLYCGLILMWSISIFIFVGCMSVSTHTDTHAHVLGGQRETLGSYHSPPSVLRHGLSQNLEFTCLTKLASELQGVPCLCFPCSRIVGASYLNILHEFWRSQHGSCLWKKYFTNQSISPAPSE